MSAHIFRKIADLALGAKARRDDEYRQFLAFFRELVETTPTDVAKLFGRFNVKSQPRGGQEAVYGIELTATDYLWWVNEIENKGTRFVNGVPRVQTAILSHIAKQAEAQGLTADERKLLLSLLIDRQA